MRLLSAAVGAATFLLSASDAMAAATACTTVAACVLGTNSSSGPGVGGTSKTGFGLSGVSNSGHGVNGTSASSFGVVGVTTENATSTGNARAGILGEDSSTNKNIFNSGVAGTSTYGIGVTGNSRSGVGGSFSGGGYVAAKTYGYGIVASSAYFGGAVTGGGDGLVAVPQGHVGLTQIDISGRTNVAAIRAVAESIVGQNPKLNNDIFQGYGCFISPDGNGNTGACGFEARIDVNGNAIFNGTVTATNITTPTATSTGQTVAAYAARSASPSLEDVGKATLRNGIAYVTLDKTFASAIDPHVAYSVFITPEGDSNGVYTSQLGPAGFAVRENKSGRSTLTFDYRIIAKPLNAKLLHLPNMARSDK